MESFYQVIKRPIISEKSAALQEVAGRYVFEVSTHANKGEIKDAVQKLFKVRVKRIHTMMVHGKSKRTARALIKKPNWKKALVTLEEGQKIEFFQTK